MHISKSLELWANHGDHVLMATRYRDQVIAEASGCHFTDVDGNRYLDMSSGQICAVVGHNHPRVVARVTDQIRRVAHTGTSYVSSTVLEASSALTRVVPKGLQRSLLLSTGAEANEYALRIAKVFTGKTGVLAMTKGYAGLTLATSSLTNYGKGAAPEVPGTGYILTPDPTQCPPGRDPLEWARTLLGASLEQNARLLNNVAAIIVEPILSAGGLIVLPDGYLAELRSLADRLGALLIADEAQTGMGRTGRWFGVEHEGIVPDILVLSKGAGGGFPVSAVLTRDEIARTVLGQANQFSSHQSDPLGAAALLGVLEVVESEGLVSAADQTGAYLRDRLVDISRTYPQLTNVRGKGLMVGFDVFRRPDNPVAETEVGRGLEDYCRARGVHTEAVQRNRFRILPPLIISRDEIDRFCGVLAGGLAEIAAGKSLVRASQNRQTAEFDARRSTLTRGLQWAWNSSPNDWLSRLTKVVRGK